MTPEETVARSFGRIGAYGDSAIFITLRPEAEALAEARALTDKSLPLYGIPVAVKDNIDVAGLPTTAACPAFAYKATNDATAVAKLRAAGAIIIGKTNLDQFATGLVGVRSPYGVPRNPINPDNIPGGSSSGSGVAVGAGLVPLALGTDTAGSGRVPAGINNIVGLKPSLGLISTNGVVPACRTLDCVSVFALTVDDAWAALRVMAGPDAADSYSRARPLGAPGAMPSHVTLGVPLAGQRLFFGDKQFEAGYNGALERLSKLGCTIVEVDIEPFYETARLLYDGPWVAERTITASKILASAPDEIHPVTKEIILSGLRPTAIDAFTAFYKLERLRRVADYIFAHQVDALALPTAPTSYTVKQVLADPIQLNSRLGTYTNFVNLLDLCGLALPASFTESGIPFGITLLAPGGDDARLAELGRVFHADTKLPMGALKTAAAAAETGCQHARHRRDCGCCGWRASVRPAAQRRTEIARRTSAGIDHDCAGLQVLCAQRHGAAQARPAARRGRQGRRDRSRGLGAFRRRFRALRRWHSLAAVDRHRQVVGWPWRERFPARGGGEPRRPRYFELRRLAQVFGEQELTTCPLIPA
jgi:allophanate hydrolase